MNRIKADIKSTPEVQAQATVLRRLQIPLPSGVLNASGVEVAFAESILDQTQPVEDIQPTASSAGGED